MWVSTLALSGCLLSFFGEAVPASLLVFAPPIAAGLGLAIAQYYGPTCDAFPDHLGGRLLLYPLGVVIAPVFWLPLRAAISRQFTVATFAFLPAIAIVAFLYLHLREHNAAPSLPRGIAFVLQALAALPIYVFALAVIAAAVAVVLALTQRGR